MLLERKYQMHVHMQWCSTKLNILYLQSQLSYLHKAHDDEFGTNNSSFSLTATVDWFCYRNVRLLVNCC